MFYPRALYPDLLNHLSQRQITVITGMRRTGKTTLLKQLLTKINTTNSVYLDLERIDNRQLFAEKNYENIITELTKRGLTTQQPLTIALDEIQLAPGISSVIKYLYDTYTIKFIVTGSSSYYLKNLFSESLAGRKKIFELTPLTFGEYKEFQGITTVATNHIWNQPFSPSEYERLKNAYEEYIRFGGFPEIALTINPQQKKDILADILSSYINIDIKTLADFHRDTHIYTLMQLLAARAGTRLDYAKLSRLTGIAQQTVKSYIDFFEKTYLIRRVPVFTYNRDREIVKAQKVYFTDTGILNQLTETSSGVQFENTIHNQLVHHTQKLQYYALKTGVEIDFIVDMKIACEAKETPTESDLTAVRGRAATIGLSHAYVIGRHPTPAFSNFIWGGTI